RHGIMIGHDRAGVEIRGKRLVTSEREAIADALDLILQAPPLLNDDDTRGLGATGLSQVASRLRAVRPAKRDLRPHACFSFPSDRGRQLACAASPHHYSSRLGSRGSPWRNRPEATHDRPLKTLAGQVWPSRSARF